MPHYTVPPRVPGARINARERRAFNAAQKPGNASDVHPSFTNPDQYGASVSLVSGSTYQMVFPEVYIIVDTATTTAITLPPAKKYLGVTIAIKSKAGSAFSIDGSGSETIEESTATRFYTGTRESVTLFSDGTSWWITSEF